MQADHVKPDESSRFRLLAEASQQITSILDINELLEWVGRLIQQAFGYYHVGIGLKEGLYRIAHKALNNTLKHFHAKNVMLRLQPSRQLIPFRRTFPRPTCPTPTRNFSYSLHYWLISTCKGNE